MAVETVTLNLPEAVYHRVKQTAEALKRPLEDVIVETLNVALPLLDDVPPEMASKLSEMSVLPDGKLWQAARSTMERARQKRLERLNDKHQRTGKLTPEEESEQQTLLRLYGETVLIRAHAMLLLKQRGFDISDPKQFAPVE